MFDLAFKLVRGGGSEYTFSTILILSRLVSVLSGRQLSVVTGRLFGRSNLPFSQGHLESLVHVSVCMYVQDVKKFFTFFIYFG